MWDLENITKHSDDRDNATSLGSAEYLCEAGKPIQEQPRGAWI